MLSLHTRKFVGVLGCVYGTEKRENPPHTHTHTNPLFASMCCCSHHAAQHPQCPPRWHAANSLYIRIPRGNPLANLAHILQQRMSSLYYNARSFFFFFSRDFYIYMPYFPSILLIFHLAKLQQVARSPLLWDTHNSPEFFII